MKKYIYLFLLLFLASCSPAYGGGGFIIPVASLGLAIWCFGRWKFGWANKEAKGSKFALICAIAMALLFIVFIVYANLSR